jgi:hypothetical protein
VATNRCIYLLRLPESPAAKIEEPRQPTLPKAERVNGGQVLPPFVQDRLQLTAAQQKKVDELQKEVDGKLDKLLTKKQLKEMREGDGRGDPAGPYQRGQILSPTLQERLQLSAEQKKMLDELQQEVDGKLAKILTAEQQKQLEVEESRQPAPPKAERITGVDITPDGSHYLVAYQKPNAVQVCTPPVREHDGRFIPKGVQGRVLHQLEGCLGRFTPDGKQVITLDPDSFTIRIYERESGKEVRRIIASQEPGKNTEKLGLSKIQNFQLSGDGSRILYEYRDSLLVRDVDTAKVRLNVWKREGATVFLLTPDGKFVFESGPKVPLRVFNLETGKESEAFPQLRNLSDIIGFSGDGNRLLRREGAKLHVHDVASGKEVNTGFDAGEGRFGQLSPDGRLFLATGDDFRKLYLWFIQGGGVWDSREPGQKIDPKQVRIAFSANGRFAVAAVDPQTVYWFDVDRQLWPANREKP